MIPALLATLLFSLSAVSGKRLSHHLSSVEANFWRFLLSAILLGTYAHLLGSGLGGGALAVFLVSGMVGFGLGDFALFQAFPRIGSRLTMVLVHCLAAPIAAVIEWFWLGATLSPAQILSGITILAGVAMALSPGKGNGVDMAHWKTGVIWGVISAFGQGYGAVLSRKAVAVVELGGMEVDGITAAYQRVLGGLSVMCLLFIIQHMRARGWIPGKELPVCRIPASLKTVVVLVLINALCGPTLGVSAYQWALNHWPAGIVLPIVALTPLVVIPFAMRFEGERPTLRSIIGSALAVAGVIALGFSLNHG